MKFYLYLIVSEFQSLCKNYYGKNLQGATEEPGHNGAFLGGIISRLQNSVETPLAPFLIVRE